jgi:putative DNA primase/helicase
MSALHPELVLAKRNVALATDKLPALEREALHLSVLCLIPLPDRIDALMDSARANGLFDQFRRDDIEHVVGQGLRGIATLARISDPAMAIRKAKGNGAGSDHTASLPDIRPLTAAQFLTLELSPRRKIVGPWLPEKGLAMIYSLRGIGKTLLGMTSAYAIAAGASFLGFTVKEPRKVLYIDGEMPAETMQERLAAIVAGFNSRPPADDYFRILISDLSSVGLPDLATPEGQGWIDAHIGDAEVLLADNLSTLVRSGKENEAEGWLPVQNWTLRHRRAGRAVVLLHHAGKAGAQRGTSRREDVLDTVISLRRPADYSPDQGARFEVHFEKSRGFYGNAAQPFEACYEVRDGAAVWTRTEIVDAERARVVAALRDGMSIRETADALGMHRSKVERLKRKATEAGEISSGAIETKD